MHSPYLTKLIVDAHIAELRHAAARSGLHRTGNDVAQPSIGSPPTPITIRPAQPVDAPALGNLAESDSAAVLRLPVLIAETHGELRAALSLRDGAAIAHPSHPSAWMVQLLHARAAQLHGGRSARQGPRSRTLNAGARGGIRRPLRS